MICNNCGKQLPENSKNCNNCGTVFLHQPKHRFCAVCGSELSANNQCPNCSIPERNDHSAPPRQKNQSNILKIALIALIFLAVAGGGVLLGLTLSKPNPETTYSTPKNDNVVAVQNDTSSQSKTEPIATGTVSHDATLQKDTTGVPDVSSDEAFNSVIIGIEPYTDPLDYDYRYGQTELIEHPSYSDFNYPGIYTCKLPEHFNKVYIQMNGADYDHYRFEAPDGTAIISLNCSANVTELSAEEMKNNEINNTSGEVTYAPHGDTWYAISTDYGYVVSYKKVFLTETEVISFEMMFPAEYLDVYDDYIEHIEDHFKPVL